MQVIFLIGRILFVAIFLVSGVRKLLDLAATAKIIEGKLWIPDVAAPYVEKLLKLEPNFTVEHFGKTYPFQRDEDRQSYMRGLRLAGVPEV